MMIHAALLLAEASLCGGVVLLLFHRRARLGLAPLYLIVGTFQYLQVVLAASVRIELTPALVINPASVVLFPITIFVVLLTYIEQDAEETRKLAYGAVMANLMLYAVAGLAGFHLDQPGHGNPLALPMGLFQQGVRLPLAATTALFVDVIAAVMVFELVSSWMPGALFWRLWLTGATVMTLDNVLFTTGAFLGRPDFRALFLSGLFAKLIGVTFYAALFAAFARFAATSRGRALAGHDRPDLFTWLTYRQRYEEARSLISRDAQTGLFNRGYFDEMAPRQLAHANRAGHAMSLVLIDIDKLKDTNDQHGHQAGDRLVVFVAAQLQQMVRSSDAACRYGGDEFAVVLTTANAHAAEVFTERLLTQVITQSQLVSPRPPWAPARVTAGIATYPADGVTLPELVLAADRRLYAGKRRGGAVVVSAEPAAAAS